MATTIENQTAILADLWLNYRQDVEFADFVEYNDIGLPLAYAIDNKIVEPTAESTRFIEETFSLLIAQLEIEDTGFETLEEVLASKE